MHDNFDYCDNCGIPIPTGQGFCYNCEPLETSEEYDQWREEELINN